MNINTKIKTGDRFNSVVVIGRLSSKKNVRVKCDCGNIFDTYTYTLSGGTTKMCKSCVDKLRKGKPLLANRIDPEQRTINELWNTFRKSMRAKEGSALRKDEWLSIIFSDCFYCSRPPSNFKKATVDHAANIWYNGVDRIDSSLPYLPDNVCAACWNCNRMKGNMSHQEFVEQVERIYDHHIGRNGASPRRLRARISSKKEDS